MGKNFLIALTIVGVVGATGALAAPPVSALTVDEIQVQIKALLARVAELTKQLNILQGQSTAPPAVSDQMSVKHRICAVLNRNLVRGASGDDVKGLQEFLRDEGYFSENATGYFGLATAQAVANWQASQGVQAVGTFGPMSRERIRIWCGGGGISNQRFNAAPQRGEAPLTVTFSTWISGFHPASDTYAIDFGDGTSESAANCYAPTDYCQSPGQNKHTYASAGTYTATLVHTSDPCMGNPMCMAPVSREVIGKLQIHVGPVSCTKEYKPVCGSKPIVCITTPCNPIEQTYSNRCLMLADGATFLYEGQCRTDPPICLAVAYQRPICALGEIVAPVDPTSPCPGPWKCVSGNKPPVISGFSGPTTLSINQTGTWTINASDPENGQLSYSVAWGDEYTVMPMMSSAARDAFVQTTTFTHAYGTAGTYNVTIVVRDASGKEAKTSSTVRVGEPLIACTADAMQCPNGTWVGRTGSNCEFFCPTSTTGASCTAARDGKVYADGQTAHYADWCAPYSLSVYCGSGYKTCKNGQWIQ